MTRIVTYHSHNADARKAWLAFIVEPNGNYLPVRFQGETEEHARGLAQAEWDKHEAEREANIRARAAARIKAAETKDRKAGAK